MSIYLITNNEVVKSFNLKVISDVLKNREVEYLQIRCKNINSLDLYYYGREVKKLTDNYGTKLIINDSLEVANKLSCGVHLGQDDGSIKNAREILGNTTLIGKSCSNLNEAILAQKEGASYLGVGAIFPTTSKNDTKVVSLSLLKSIKNSVNIPIIAIGGINITNVKSVLECNVDSIAVISTIFSANNPIIAVSELYNYMK